MARTEAWIVGVALSAMMATIGAPALAKKNDPNVVLDFRPQQAVAGAEANVSPDMLRRPVALKVEDLRPGDKPAEIGTRTDDNDRKHTLNAVNEVEPYVATVLEDLLYQWGAQTSEDSELMLVISLSRFHVLETNQAVGATYNANVHLAAEVTGAAEWTGGGSGDATRYGRKFSNANVNEVLSDALLEALADLVSDPGLHRAWKP